jgi:hypothetical protein
MPFLDSRILETNNYLVGGGGTHALLHAEFFEKIF